MSGTINLQTLGGGGDVFGLYTITEDISFSASSEEDTTIDIGKEVGEIVRGRLYIDTDPGAAFSQWATITFYN